MGGGQEIRRSAHLEEGDLLEAELTADGILLRPQKLIDAAQAWFWDSDWQEGEREADEDLAAQRVESFETGKDLLTALRTGFDPARIVSGKCAVGTQSVKPAAFAEG